MSQHRIVWSGPARRDMTRLPQRIAVAVVVFVTDRLASNPERLSKPLGGDLSGYCSARNGDYRVLFRLDEGQHVLWIMHVDHRAHVYRPR